VSVSLHDKKTETKAHPLETPSGNRATTEDLFAFPKPKPGTPKTQTNRIGRRHDLQHVRELLSLKNTPPPPPTHTKKRKRSPSKVEWFLGQYGEGKHGRKRMTQSVDQLPRHFSDPACTNEASVYSQRDISPQAFGKVTPIELNR
jgi:hypothetical protein